MYVCVCVRAYTHSSPPFPPLSELLTYTYPKYQWGKKRRHPHTIKIPEYNPCLCVYVCVCVCVCMCLHPPNPLSSRPSLPPFSRLPCVCVCVYVYVCFFSPQQVAMAVPPARPAEAERIHVRVCVCVLPLGVCDFFRAGCCSSTCGSRNGPSSCS